jgi:hypothetical protein
MELYEGYLSVAWHCDLPLPALIERIAPLVAAEGWPDGKAIAFNGRLGKHEETTVPAVVRGDLTDIIFLRLELPGQTLIWDSIDAELGAITPTLDAAIDGLMRATCGDRR